METAKNVFSRNDNADTFRRDIFIPLIIKSIESEIRLMILDEAKLNV